MSGILLGTSISRRAEAASREQAAQASLAALARSGLADCVNLDFADAEPFAGPCQQRRVLRSDARTASGVHGPRKPIVTEMLDVLAAEAIRLGARRIGLVNGDIVVTPEAAERAVSTDLPALAFSRTDLDDGSETQLLYGVDMFTFDVTFWRQWRDRFRDYILGDAAWDNVYASIVACHGGGILNRERLILHECHPAAFHVSPYAEYIHLLAARDSSYFTLWCAYVEQLKTLRAGGGTPEDEEALQRAVFRRPGYAANALDAARAAWWRARRTLGA